MSQASAENFNKFEDVSGASNSGANLYQQIDMTSFNRDKFKANTFTTAIKDVEIVGSNQGILPTCDTAKGGNLFSDRLIDRKISSDLKTKPEDESEKSSDKKPSATIAPMNLFGSPKPDPWASRRESRDVSDDALFKAMNHDDQPRWRDYAKEKPVDTKEKAEHPERFKRIELENAIKKADEAMPEKDFEKTVGELQLMLMLAEKTSPKPFARPDEKSTEIGPDGLSSTQKEEVQKKFQETTGKLTAPVKARLKYAEFLADCGGYSEAAKVGAEAQQLAEKFSKPAKITDHITATPTDLEKRDRDLSAGKFASMLAKPNGKREGMSNSLIESNLFLSKLYLGADLDWNSGVSDKLGDSKMFDPVKAFDAAVKARDYIKKIPANDTASEKYADSKEVKNMFSALEKVFKNPDAYKLYDRTDSDGKPFNKEKVEAIRKFFESKQMQNDRKEAPSDGKSNGLLPMKSRFGFDAEPTCAISGEVRSEHERRSLMTPPIAK